MTHTQKCKSLENNTNYTHTKKPQFCKRVTDAAFILPPLPFFFLISQCFWATYRHIYVFCSGELGCTISESHGRHASGWVYLHLGVTAPIPTSSPGSVPISSISIRVMLWVLVQWARDT